MTVLTTVLLIMAAVSVTIPLAMLYGRYQYQNGYKDGSDAMYAIFKRSQKSKESENE